MDPSDPRPPSAAQACFGLALSGWGLAVLTHAVPHEDPVVAAGLLTFGVALVAMAPRFPRVALPPAAVAIPGVLLCLAVAAGTAWFGNGWDEPKVALFLVGLALAGLAPLARRDVRWRGQAVPVSSFAAALAAAVAAPLLAWAAQAAFKSGVGATPTEAFVSHGLVAPVAALLSILGWHPVAAGQSLAFDGPPGRLDVDIGAACSGIQAMAVFGGVLAIFLVTQRPPPGVMAVWTAVGLAGVYVANLVRIVAIVAVGHAWGVAALLRAHAQAGWVVFVAWALLFAHLARRHVAATAAPPAVVA